MLSNSSFSFFPYLLLGSLLLGGCDLLGSDDEDPVPPETTGVLVANGGNFTDQNGTLTVYDPQTMQASTPLDFNAFVHSVNLHEGRLYAQLNTGFSAGRISVIDPEALSTTAQSDSLGPTRNVAFPANDTTRGYVSTLQGTVRRFDPQTGNLEENPIKVGPSASDLVVADSKVFVTVPDTSLALSDTISNNGSTLAVFDADSPSNVRSIELGCDGPTHVSQDEDGELVVVCTGQTTFNADFSEVLGRTNGAIVFVDPASETRINRIPADQQFGSRTGTQTAHYDPTSAFLHAAGSRAGTVTRVDTDANAVVESISVPENSSLTGIAALAYDGTAQRLYLARTDVQDPFQSRGTVVVLGSSREVVEQFLVGPAPSHVALRRRAR